MTAKSSELYAENETLMLELERFEAAIAKLVAATAAASKVGEWLSVVRFAFEPRLWIYAGALDGTSIFVFV